MLTFAKATNNLLNFKSKVVSTSATSYNLDISGNVEGTFTYNKGTGITLSGTLFFTKMSGEMQVRQSDLATESAHVVIKGIALLFEHPVPLPIQILMPITLTVNVEQTSPRPMIEFPLYDGKWGIISTAYATAVINLSSIGLRILNMFYPNIPKGINLHIGIGIPPLPYSVNQEEVTVQAGEFTAYNIKLAFGIVGNIFVALPALILITMSKNEFK